MKEITLNDFIIESIKEEHNHEPEKTFLVSTSQELLLLINIILVADITGNKSNIPANFCGNFYLAFQKPSLGKLLNNSFWLASKSNNKGTENLRTYLLQSEQKKRGWISKTVELRNAYIHPGKISKEEALSLAKIHLNEIPDLSHLGKLVINESVAWHEEKGQINMFPFAIIERDEIVTFSEFVYPDTLDFPVESSIALIAFRELWTSIKYDDKELSSPTIEDLRVKINKAYEQKIYSGKIPKSIKTIMHNTQIGLLIETGIADGIIKGLQTSDNKPFVIDITLTPNESLLERLRMNLELFNPPEIEQLNNLSTKERPLILLIRTDEIPENDFLQVLYLIADIYEVNSKSSLKFLVERGEANLIKDQNSLWDDLPDDFDKLFRKYKLNNSFQLIDFMWKLEREKVLGMF